METLVEELRARESERVAQSDVRKAMLFEARLVRELRLEGLAAVAGLLGAPRGAARDVGGWLAGRRSATACAAWCVSPVCGYPRRDGLLLPRPGVPAGLGATVAAVLAAVADGRGTRCADGAPARPWVEVQPGAVFVQWAAVAGPVRALYRHLLDDMRACGGLDEHVQAVALYPEHALVDAADPLVAAILRTC